MSGNRLPSAGSLLITPAFQPTHGFTLQIYLDAAVDEPIQNRVGQGRIVDVVVPVLYRHLSKDDRGTNTNAVIQHADRAIKGWALSP